MVTESAKFDPDDQEKTWNGFDRYEGTPVSVATIFQMARECGWQEPLGDVSRASTGKELLTDLGNARRLVRRHGADIRYVHAWRKWVVWDGAKWRIDDSGEIERRAKETVEVMHAKAQAIGDEEARKKLRGHALKCQAEARLSAMVRLAESEPEVVLPPHAFDADPWVLGVRNGVIELRTGTFRSARREDYITQYAGVIYNAGADCPTWKKFLDTIMGGDAELVAYLQRVVGYFLTGSVQEEVLFVLWGTGRNGKSTFRETIHALLGSYAISADAGLLVQRQAPGNATPDVARLKGRRLVAINETSQKDHLNETRVKFLTSNDKITARNLYSEPFGLHSDAQSHLDDKP